MSDQTQQLTNDAAGENNTHEAVGHGVIPVVVPPIVLEVLIPWMESHEGDIAMGINDFGDLQLVFEALFMRKAEKYD